MPTESELTAELIKDIKRREKQWLCLKHSDRFTAGIPDVSISHPQNLTVWVEVKEFTNLDQVLSMPSTWVDNLLQVEMLIRLNGVFYVYDPFDDRAALVRGAVVKLAYPGKETLILSPQFNMFKGQGFDRVHQYVKHTFELGGRDVDIRNL